MSIVDPRAMAGEPDDRPASSRVAWVDIAKGWCIVLVVTMHSALGVGLATGETGWLHQVVAFAKPFRIPDFFLISGLFLGAAIDLPWRAFLDRKAVHFLYFYALWLLIVLGFKAGELGIQAPLPFLREYLRGFAEPFSSMWFIHLLPFLFVTARLLRKMPVAPVLAAAGMLHVLAASFPGGGIYAMTSVLTGWTALDSYCLFLVYFLAGHYFRAPIFDFAETVAARPLLSLAGLTVWAIAEFSGVRSGLTEMPGLTLLFGLAGGFAVVALSALMARRQIAAWLGWCGKRSLAIYCAFVLPMAATRIFLLRTGLVADVGWQSLIVATVAIGAPLALAAAVRGTRLAFLFTRPRWAQIPDSAQPARAGRTGPGRSP